MALPGPLGMPEPQPAVSAARARGSVLLWVVLFLAVLSVLNLAASSVLWLDARAEARSASEARTQTLQEVGAAERRLSQELVAAERRITDRAHASELHYAEMREAYNFAVAKAFGEVGVEFRIEE